MIGQTPSEVISRISRAEDRQDAIQLFLLFSRFEYALKRRGFVSVTHGGQVKPDWDRYARENDWLTNENGLRRPVDSIRDHVEYLLKVPPKKQVVEEQDLTWKPDNHDGPDDLVRVLTLVRRVRNNLFHGGKFPGAPVEEIARDRRLLEASIEILYFCLDADESLYSYFIEDFEHL